MTSSDPRPELRRSDEQLLWAKRAGAAARVAYWVSLIQLVLLLIPVVVFIAGFAALFVLLR